MLAVLAILLVAAGLVIATVGLLGLLQRLPRNRFVGVRTSATLRDEEAFRLANRVAGLPTLVAGAVAVLAGLAGYLAPTTGGLLASVIIGLVGLLAITVGAGVLGHRAALAVPKPTGTPTPAPAACKACDCGGTCFAQPARSVGPNVTGVGGE
jgi:uncharacterized membrane protein